jgi:hypothetical protein
MLWGLKEHQVDQDSDLNRKVQELLRDARSADKIDKERAELFGAMIRSAAWHEYCDLINSRLQGMADEIIKPSGSIDAMVSLEYVKGAMSGLILARDLPAVTIAAMDQLRRDRSPSADEEESEDE